MSGRRWRTRLAAAAGSLLLGGGLAVSAAPPAQADESTQVLLLLDVSGSMNEKISSGGTKFAAAKRALRDVADALPAGTQVGLRVYGSEIAEPKDENPKACTDTELVLPIGPLNKAKMNDAVDSFTAKGETPIAYSLQQSVKDFRGDGKRVLVLISDGEETCVKDPCPTAKKLAKSGVDLQFNAIGLDVGAKARQQLQCITKAGDGNYYDAEQHRRPHRRTASHHPAGAAPLPGDRHPGRRAPRTSRVPRRSAPGSTRTATTPARSSATTGSPGPRVPRSPPRSGRSCALSTAERRAVDDDVDHARRGGLRHHPGHDRQLEGRHPVRRQHQLRPGRRSHPQAGPGSVRDRTRADAVVEAAVAARQRRRRGGGDRGGGGAGDHEPHALPEPVTDYDGETGRVKAGKASAVLGGTSFSNATEVNPGTYTDSMATGETVFYKVRLQPGQRVRATATTPAPKTSWHLASAELVTSRVMLYSPSRTLLTSQEANLQGDGSVTVSAASPQVRVRNREAPSVRAGGTPSVSTASQAGDYYVAVAGGPAAELPDRSGDADQVAIAVDGSPAGLPEYAAPASPTPTPDPLRRRPLPPRPSRAIKTGRRLAARGHRRVADLADRHRHRAAGRRRGSRRCPAGPAPVRLTGDQPASTIIVEDDQWLVKTPDD